MGLVGSIIIGFLLGIIAKLLKPDINDGLFKITEILGSIGAVTAFEMGVVTGLYRAENPAGYIASIAGGLSVLGLYRWFNGRRRKARDLKTT